MKIAFVHYHLRPGGVTRIIENQCEILKKRNVAHVVLSGDSAGTHLPHVNLPGLDYASPENRENSEFLLRQIREAAAQALGGAPDLWHFHNHSIGLNPAFSQLPALLAKNGQRLLLQTHDFAEDGRPANFQALGDQKNLFPLASQIHYAFINTRDQARLIQSGLPEKSAHYLPNAVNIPKIPPAKSSQTLVFSPARAIRRKNVGETLLLAALAPADTRFAFALPPLETSDEFVYRRWLHFAKKAKLPVDFEIVGRLAPPGKKDPTKKDFATWLAASSHLLTTSIAEGFGLSFLEAAALKKPLLGRDLPEITRDFFPKSGQFKNLYSSLPISCDLLDIKNLRRQFAEKIARYFSQYGQILAPNEIERAWENFTTNDNVDFGNLPESTQEKLILHAQKKPDDFPIRHRLRKWLTHAEADDLPAQKFSMAAHEENLFSIYQTILKNPITAPEFLAREKVLTKFLNPEKFHFLRS